NAHPDPRPPMIPYPSETTHGASIGASAAIKNPTHINALPARIVFFAPILCCSHPPIIFPKANTAIISVKGRLDTAVETSNSFFIYGLNTVQMYGLPWTKFTAAAITKIKYRLLFHSFLISYPHLIHIFHRKPNWGRGISENPPSPIRFNLPLI